MTPLPDSSANPSSLSDGARSEHRRLWFLGFIALVQLVWHVFLFIDVTPPPNTFDIGGLGELGQTLVVIGGAITGVALIGMACRNDVSTYWFVVPASLAALLGVWALSTRLISDGVSKDTIQTAFYTLFNLTMAFVPAWLRVIDKTRAPKNGHGSS